MKAVKTEIGMASAILKMNLILRRNIHRTNIARNPPVKARFLIWSIFLDMSSAWLLCTTISTPSASRSSLIVSMASRVISDKAIRFACGSLERRIETASLPLTLLNDSCSLTPKNTSATSLSKSGPFSDTTRLWIFLISDNSAVT